MTAFLRTILLTATLANASFAQTTGDDFWIVNGHVSAMALAGRTLYVGGAVNRVSPPTGNAVPLSLGDGTLMRGFPRIRGIGAKAVISDGAGGWYVGGEFTSVGGAPRRNLAHVRPDLSVSDWSGDVPGPVSALTLAGDRLYVGGPGYLTAVQVTSGRRLPWLASLSGQPSAIVAALGRVVVSGSFYTLEGHNTYGLAALDSTSGAWLDWNPAEGLGVPLDARAMAVVGNVLYVAGGFDGKLSGVARRNLAAIDMVTGEILPWNPAPDGDVACLLVQGGRMWIGGGFRSVAGSARSHAAAIDVVTGELLPWAPGIDGHVDALVPTADVVFALGQFTHVAGEVRRFAAALDATSGRPTPWTATYLTGWPTFAALGRDALYVGGDLIFSAGGVARNGVAALDAITGEPRAWNPRVSDVSALLVDRDVVYVGGAFTSVNGRPHRHLAAIDRRTGRLGSWAPDPDGPVLALAKRKGTMYVGGSFTHIRGRARGAGAAFRLQTRRLRAWDPQASLAGGSASIRALALRGTQVLVGGTFDLVSSAPRSNLAAVDGTFGVPTPWDPGADRPVYALATQGRSVYAGGLFERVGGESHPYLAELDAESGAAMPVTPTPQDYVFALQVADGVLYAGGFGNPTAMDVTTRLALPWPVELAGRVTSLAAADDRVYLGTAGFDGVRLTRAAVVPHALPVLAVAGRAAVVASRRGAGRYVLAFALPSTALVRLSIYDIAGRRIEELAHGLLPAGQHDFTWNPSRSSGAIRAGIYFVRLEAGDSRSVAKLVVW